MTTLQDSRLEHLLLSKNRKHRKKQVFGMTVAPVAGLNIQSLTLSSAEQAANANSLVGWRLQYDQLSCGSFDGFIQQIQLPDAVVIRESSNQRVHQHGQMNQSSYGLALPMRMSGSSSFHAHMVSVNSLLLGSGDELDLCTSERFELAGLVVNKTLLDTIWADLFAGASVPFATLHFAKLTDGVASETLRQAFRLAFDVARYEPTFNPLLLRDALIESWVGVLSKDEVIPDLRAASARQRLVHRTIDTLHTLIEAGDGHMPTLLTLCRHVGASPRKLNYCFQETLGLSPKNYLRAYRLNQ
ncbi:MAG: hypothetical protein EAZ66_07695, partial [Alphaproteobacteria bacterium]